MNVKGISASIIGAVMLVSAAGSFADTPGRHPAYLRARTDLRRAERLMGVREEPNVMRDLSAAAHETQEAIREIDAAEKNDIRDRIRTSQEFAAVAELAVEPLHRIGDDLAVPLAEILVLMRHHRGRARIGVDPDLAHRIP